MHDACRYGNSLLKKVSIIIDIFIQLNGHLEFGNNQHLLLLVELHLESHFKMEFQTFWRIIWRMKMYYEIMAVVKINQR